MSNQRVHTQPARFLHFAIDQKGGAACPRCKVGISSQCKGLSHHTVHIERVAAMGYNIFVPGV